jgi:hypothetical protein
VSPAIDSWQQGLEGCHGAMIGPWGPLPERTLLSVVPLVRVRAASLLVLGCSGGSGQHT